MIRLLTCLLLLVAVQGCATTNYVPVAMKRQLPRQPAECTAPEPQFPRVPTGGVVSPKDSAQWAIKVRRWRLSVASQRQVCAAYAKRVKGWK